MDRDRGDVDLWNVIDAERGGGAHSRHLQREVGKAPTVQDVIGGGRPDRAGAPLDSDARMHLERVPFNAGLKLLIAVVGEADHSPGQEHRRQRNVKRKGRVIAPAESTTYISVLSINARRLE